MARLAAVLAVLAAACIQPAPAASPHAAAPGVATIEDCHATIAVAGAATAPGDAGAEPVPEDAGGDAAAPSDADAQAYLRTKLQPALERNRDAVASCLGAPPRLLVFDLAFTMSTAGVFDRVAVEGSLAPAIQPCLAGVLRGLALPTPPLDIEGRCRVRYQGIGSPPPASRSE